MPSDVQALTDLAHHEFMEIMSKYLYEFTSFRWAFAPFHSFTVLVLTRGFKRASPSRIKGPGDLGFKERVMLRGYRACFDSWV